MKVTLDGVAKTITVNAGITAITIRQDVYSAWKYWVLTGTNAKFLPAVRVIGGDPVGSGLYAGDIYFLTNGWKLVVDLTQTQVSGVLYSDDYATAYYTPAMVAQYPATVSNLVSGVAGLTPAQSADLLAKLTAINAGIQKASLLIPYSGALP